MIKTTINTLIILLISTSVFGQYKAIRPVENYAASRIGAFYSRGFILPHSKVMLNLPQGPVEQVEIFYERQLKGTKNWHHTHALPAWRVFTTVTGFGNQEAIGPAITVGGALNFPLFRSKHFQLSEVTTFGLGFFPKRYKSGQLEGNPAIGSILNFHVRFALEGEFRIHKNFFALTGISFGHWSNGAVKMPNLGINVPSFYVGLKGAWDLYDAYTQRPSKVKYPFTLNLQANAGMKEIDPPNGKIYPIAVFMVEASKQLTRKSTITFGNDFFYDKSNLHKSRFLQKEDLGGKMNFRSGFHVGYEFNVDKLVIYGHLGVYYLRFDKLSGPIYERLGLKYRVHKNVYLNAALKVHMFTADCVELGVGYKLNLQKKHHEKVF